MIRIRTIRAPYLQESAVAAAPCNSLWATQVDVHCVTLSFDVARSLEDGLGVVATELNNQRPVCITRLEYIN